MPFTPPDFLMSPEASLGFRPCSEAGINYNDSCDPTAERCLRRDISHHPRQRILDLVYSDNSFVPRKFWNVIQKMRQMLTVEDGKDTLLVSGCSSNHFTETQAQIKNLHTNIFPAMPNIKYVLYDLGLTPEERRDLEMYGNATVLDFPFNEVPGFFKNLRCFSWKVFVIAAHLQQAEVLIWGDSSARFKGTARLKELIDRTKTRGVQQKCSVGQVPTPLHTDPTMFEMWGDSPCAHRPYRMCQGNFGVYHNEPFVHRAIMTPWLACAAKEDCMCKDNALDSNVQECRWPKHVNNSMWIGTCHRFDQSMISIILAKLFREKYYHFAVNTDVAEVTLRDNGIEYFAELKGKS